MVRYSPGVPGGAVGGGTWSNQPSFSSYMTNSAVFDHTFGLAVERVEHQRDEPHAPFVGGADGCSSNPSGGMIHDTLGNLPRLDVGDEVVRERRLERLLVQRRDRVPERLEVRQDVVGDEHDLGVGDRVVERRVPGRVLLQRRVLAARRPRWTGCRPSTRRPRPRGPPASSARCSSRATSGAGVGLRRSDRRLARSGRSCRCWPSAGWGGSGRGSSSGRRRTA